jgi:hypothetical protein
MALAIAKAIGLINPKIKTVNFGEEKPASLSLPGSCLMDIFTTVNSDKREARDSEEQKPE